MGRVAPDAALLIGGESDQSKTGLTDDAIGGEREVVLADVAHFGDRVQDEVSRALLTHIFSRFLGGGALDTGPVCLKDLVDGALAALLDAGCEIETG